MTSSFNALKICIFTTNPAGVYSGGRYLSMMMAYALARAGAEVTYLTNIAPIFDADFDIFHASYPVTKVVGPSFAPPPDYRADWVIVIPTGGFDDGFYETALRHAHSWGARMALMSFETPNWYDALSPYPRSALPTESWRKVVAQGGLVITIAREGVAPAIAYYGAGRGREDLIFGHWHPPVNDLVAATIPATTQPRRRIVCFVRTNDRHKGAQDLLRLPPDLFDGHVLALVFGRGVDAAYVAALRRHFAGARDFAIEVHSQIEDREKFALLATARLLLFPSYFEGYGYPPVEAGWMGVPSVVYDLPVLRETLGDTALYATSGDTDGFAAAVRTALADRPCGPQVRAAMRITPDTATAGAELLALLARARDVVPPIGPPLAARAVQPNAQILKDSDLQGFLAAQSTGTTLANLRVQVEGHRVRISGIASRAKVGDVLRFQMAGAHIPDLPLQPAAAHDQNFEALGHVETLPAGEATLCTLCLHRADGSLAPAIELAITLNAEALFDRKLWAPGIPNSPGATGAEVLVLADPATLYGDPQASLTLAEICNRLAEGGVGTRLLLASARGDLSTATPPEPDLLPLADAVEVLDTADLITRGRAELAAGNPVVLLGAALSDVLLTKGCSVLAEFHPETARQPIRILTRPHEKAVARGVAGTTTAPYIVTADPGPQAARRSLLGLKPPLLVLAGTARQEAPPLCLLALLKRLERRLGALRVLQPRRLVGTAAALPFSHLSRIERVDEAELARAIGQADQVIGLMLAKDTADAATLALLTAFRAAVLQIPGDDADVTAVAEQILARCAQTRAAPTRISAVITEIFALAPQDEAAMMADVMFPATPIAAPLALGPAQAAKRLPKLGSDRILSFVLPGVGHEGALVSGWSAVEMGGALLANAPPEASSQVSPGVVGFQMNQALPTEPLLLELLIRVHDPIKGHPDLGVSLNGQYLGAVSPARSGVTRHAFRVPVTAWRAEGSQFLVLAWRGIPLAPPPAEPAKPAQRLSLVALALAPVSEKTPDWSDIGAEITTLAPLIQTDLTSTDVAHEVQFGQGSPRAFARLGRGWSRPEATGTWSNGSDAVLEFEPPLFGQSPLVLRLEGSPLQVDGTAMQRLSLALGRRAVADTVLSASQPEPVEVVIPAGQAAQEVDHLLLRFADATAPRSLGLNDDIRTLGLFLTAARLGRTTTRCFVHQGGLPVAVPAQPGVLVLSGPGPVPAGLRLALSGSTLLAYPQAVSVDRWECGLRLNAARLADPCLIVLVAQKDPQAEQRPESLIDRVEIWADADAGDVPARVLPLRLQGLSLPAGGDLRDWAAKVAVAHAAELMATPLVLPLLARLAADSGDVAILGAGWSSPESSHVWSDKPDAELRLGGRLAGQDHLAVLHSAALVAPGHALQRIGVTLGGMRVATLLEQSATPHPHPVPLPVEAVTADNVLCLELPDAASPQELGLSPDPRKLGMTLQALELHKLAPAGPGLWAGFVPDDTLEGVDDWQVSLRASAESGLVLELTGTAEGPFGLSLGGTDVVMHPLATATGWRCLLLVPPMPELAAEPAHRLWVYRSDGNGHVDAGHRLPGPAVLITAQKMAAGQ